MFIFCVYVCYYCCLKLVVVVVCGFEEFFLEYLFLKRVEIVNWKVLLVVYNVLLILVFGFDDLWL